MSKTLLNDIKFKSEIKKFYEEYKEHILDIILFGSALKGKETPKDIDLLILFKNKKNFDLSYALKKKLEKYKYSAEIQDLAYKDFFEDSFKAKESVISEGYSLIYNKFLAEGLGFINYVLFKYELKGMTKSERMRFYYSIYGRTKKQKGILNTLNAIKFSESIFLCPIETSEQMKEFLNNWKIKFIDFSIMMPSRIKNIL